MKLRRVLIGIFLMALLAGVLTFTLVGCNTIRKSEVTQIQIKDSIVYLAPEGEAREFQIEATVIPIDASNKKIYYKHVNSSDREFLEVSLDGRLFARKLKEDEYGENVPIPIKLVSADNPNATIEIKVIIERVPVQKIIFRETNLSIQLQETSKKLTPIYVPYHASLGRDLTYTSGNPEIATVDREGNIYPRSIGVVDIWAISRPEGSREDIRSHIIVHIEYAPLNYRLDIVNEVIGNELDFALEDKDEITFTLQRLDNICDPNPKITWYVNDTAINEPGVKDNPTLTYVPGSLPVGEYYIKAKLTNSSQMQMLSSIRINVYYKLENLNIDVWNMGELTTGDILRVKATYANATFPPKSYKWDIITPSGKQILYTLATGTHSEIVDLEYAFNEAGEYKIQAEAIVKGASSSILSNEEIVNVSAASHGTDIFGLTVEGKKQGANIVPYIYWDPLPYKTTYKVEISKRVGENHILYSYDSTRSSDSSLFERNGMYLRTEDVTFSDSFEVRVRGGRYNWSPKITYQAGSITPYVYTYFNEIAPTINSYIANMEDFGRLMSYVTIFRPTSLETEQNQYKFDLYIPFTYEGLESGVYTKGAAGTPATTDVAKINLYNLIATAVATYAESTSYTLTWGETQVIGGKNQFTIKINTPAEPSSYRTPVTRPKANAITNYSSTGRIEGEKLPINALPPFAVKTSNQLYWAAINGYKPVPEPNSAAASIYAIATHVLMTINSSGMNDAQKLLSIYDWLSTNVGYDNELLDQSLSGGSYDSNADSFFLEGVFKAIFNASQEVTQVLPGAAVCDGLAKAFALLASMEGINNYRIVGTTNETQVVGHAWNYVMVAGRWYAMDSTWSSEPIQINGVTHELLSHKYAFMTKPEAAVNRQAYGRYPELENSRVAEKEYHAYMIDVSPDNTYDLYIQSDEELEYFLTNYLTSKIGQRNDVWCDIYLSDAYLNELYQRELAAGGTMTFDVFVQNGNHYKYFDEIRIRANNGFNGMKIDVIHSDQRVYCQLYKT